MSRELASSDDDSSTFRARAATCSEIETVNKHRHQVPLIPLSLQLLSEDSQVSCTSRNIFWQAEWLFNIYKSLLLDWKKILQPEKVFCRSEKLQQWLQNLLSK